MNTDQNIGGFKLGDKVKLQVGKGPEMSVSGLTASVGTIHCKWFSGTKLQDGRFKAHDLVHVDGEGDQ